MVYPRVGAMLWVTCLVSVPDALTVAERKCLSQPLAVDHVVARDLQANLIQHLQETVYAVTGPQKSAANSSEKRAVAHRDR